MSKYADQGLLALSRGRIGAEDLGEERQLTQMTQRTRCDARILRRGEVQVEEILPRLPGNRSRLDLEQIQVAEREDAETLVQCAWQILECEDDRRLQYTAFRLRCRFRTRFRNQ